MSSRKNLKKGINTTFDLLYADCIFYKIYVIDSDKEAADNLIDKIAGVHSEILSRVNVVEGKNTKDRVKKYYSNLRFYIKEQIDILGKEIAALP